MLVVMVTNTDILPIPYGISYFGTLRKLDV